MIRTINVAERGIYPNGAAPVTIPAAVSTVLIPDQTVIPKVTEIAYRYVQNTGANPIYYAFGQQASTNNYHGILQPYAQMDCSNHRLSVNGFATGGSVAAITILYRNDNDRNNSGAQPIIK